MSDEPLIWDPPRVVVAAYLLALVCLLVPFAIVGALFAGAVLARRNRPLAGAGVLALTLVCTALAVTVLRWSLRPLGRPVTLSAVVGPRRRRFLPGLRARPAPRARHRLGSLQRLRRRQPGQRVVRHGKHVLGERADVLDEAVALLPQHGVVRIEPARRLLRLAADLRPRARPAGGDLPPATATAP